MIGTFVPFCILILLKVLLIEKSRDALEGFDNTQSLTDATSPI